MIIVTVSREAGVDKSKTARLQMIRKSPKEILVDFIHSMDRTLTKDFIRKNLGRVKDEDTVRRYWKWGLQFGVVKDVDKNTINYYMFDFKIADF